MKIIEKKLVENEIKDLDDKIRDLKLKKAQVERKISLEKNEALKKRMEKDLRGLSKELAETEKKRKGNVKKSGKILAGMRKVEETKTLLLKNMQKITLLVNDLLKDPVGDAIREVLEGSEGVKKGSPMALSILKTEGSDYGAGEAEKLHGSDARKMKDLSLKGSYAFRDPKNNSLFKETDEKFVLKFGALEYLKQKKSQVSEKKSSLPGLKRTWRFIKKATSVCNAVLNVASEIGGSLSNLHKAVSLSKSGASLKAPWKRSSGTGTTIDKLKSGSFGGIEGLSDFSELILGK
jgi:hypothetical protein